MTTGGEAEHSLGDVLVFFLLAFALTWVAWAWAAMTEQPPLLGGLGPTLAAALSAVIFFRTRGLRKLFGRLSKWRVSPWLYLIALLWGPALMASGILLLFAIGARDFQFPPLSQLFFGALFLVVFATLEEIGWRGYALPRLQSRLGALVASLLLGLIHGLWHLPLYWIAGTGMGPFSTEGLLMFLAGIIPGAVLLTFLFNSSSGSLLPVILAHTSYNVFGHAVSFSGVARQTYELATVATAIMVAAVIVLVFGRQRLAWQSSVATSEF